MNCFQLIKSVLDELYAEIPIQNEKEKDKAINSQFDYLQLRYRNLLKENLPIDYRDPVTRFAYIYRYVTCHANIMYELLSKNQGLVELMNTKIINLTCLGGGPGSDFLGIYKFLLNNKLTPNLRNSILDREPIWAESWGDIDEKLEAPFKISTNFLSFDITNPETYTGYKKTFSTCDLFSLMFFVSELYHSIEKSIPFLKTYLLI